MNFHTYIGPAQTGANVFSCNLIDRGLEADGVVLGNLAGFHQAQRGGQVVLGSQGPMGIGGILGEPFEMLIPPRYKLLFQISIGLFQSLDAGHTQPFDQPVLRRLETAFHAAFGLSRQLRFMRTN